jgi:flagella basal body P-ring formation protein FlgA
MKYILILLILTCKLLFAQYELQKEYPFMQDTLYSNDLFAELKVFELFTLDPKKMSYRIKATELQNIFAKHGVTVTYTSPIIRFKRVFDFDMSALHVKLKTYYKKYYPDITIHALHVRPKTYLEALPESYDMIIPPKNFHRNEGTFYLKTQSKRRVFFDYKLDATLPVLSAKKTIERKEPLSSFNTRIKTVTFESFTSPPLSQLKESQWCAKIRLKEGRLIAQRNIEPIPLIKRDQNVIAIINNGALHVELSATAQNDGALYDMITITKSNGESLEAQVVGPNRVEIK